MPTSHSAATELEQLLGTGTAGELIPELVRQGLQAFIEAEAATAPGADRHQRTDERRGHRNGSRDRLLTTPAGYIQLRIPCLPDGRLLPVAAGAPPAGGSCPVGCRDGGLRLRGLHPKSE